MFNLTFSKDSILHVLRDADILLKKKETNY